ncbi:hypothetical protein J2799_004663 [Chryseobacterium vietnamense]|nr:hypothetical protein [Chryseobacterium vietnamense]
MESILAETGEFYVFLIVDVVKSLFGSFFPQITRMTQMIAHSIFNRGGL